VGEEIPPRLYAAVAQVLTYIYQIKHPTGPRPAGPPEVLVDEDLALRPWQRQPGGVDP
jgi:hypothetical protein